MLLAAFVAGTTRNFSEAALLRGIGDTTRGSGMLRAHAIRTTVNQAAIFGSPFLGLLLFRLGGTDAVMLGICALQLAALAVLVPVPPIGPRAADRERPPLAVGLASLRSNPRLRRIGWVNFTWNVFSGAALGIMPAVLREHVGMDEVTAGATLVAGALAVVALTLPVVRTGQRRVGPLATFLFAVAIEGAALLLLAGRLGDPPGAARLRRLPAREQRRCRVAQRRPRARGRDRSPVLPQPDPDGRRPRSGSCSASSWPQGSSARSTSPPCSC